MSESVSFPEDIVVAADAQDFFRVAHKFGMDPFGTEWSRPGGPLYGIRAERIIISAAVLAAPPERFDRWVQVCLMTRLAVDGELIEEVSDDAPEEEATAVDDVAV